MMEMMVESIHCSLQGSGTFLIGVGMSTSDKENTGIVAL